MENLPKLAEQEFNQITKTHKGIIPKTIEDVIGKLNGLSNLLIASDWYRAAIVDAYVKPKSRGRPLKNDEFSPFLTRQTIKK